MNIKVLTFVIVTIILAVIGIVGKAFPVERPLVLVTYPFEPYIFSNESEYKGMDYEITEEVFKILHIPIKIVQYPWKRCLIMMMNGDADAIIDLLRTEEREEYLFFPEEPVSTNPLIVFYRMGNRPDIERLNDLKRYVVGTQLGWEYPDELNLVLTNREDVHSMEQNFQKLANGRVDVMVENRVVGLYTSNAMGLSELIGVVDLPKSFISPYYVGFAKNEGYDILARKFSAALKKFKKSKKYSDIMKRYGQQ